MINLLVFVRSFIKALIYHSFWVFVVTVASALVVIAFPICFRLMAYTVGHSHPVIDYTMGHSDPVIDYTVGHSDPLIAYTMGHSDPLIAYTVGYSDLLTDTVILS